MHRHLLNLKHYAVLSHTRVQQAKMDGSMLERPASRKIRDQSRSAPRSDGFQVRFFILAGSTMVTEILTL